MTSARRSKWRIRVSGYGTFDFEGTEAEAEEMRVHKARWEQGTAIKWRADLSTEVDRLTAECARLWDAHKGAPSSLMTRLRKAKEATT